MAIKDQHPLAGEMLQGRGCIAATGRKQLTEQTGRWERLTRAVNLVLRPAEE